MHTEHNTIPLYGTQTRQKYTSQMVVDTDVFEQNSRIYSNPFYTLYNGVDKTEYIHVGVKMVMV